MQRISGLSDEQVLIYEARAEAALRAVLEQVMDVIARRIEASAPILASVLVAADQGDEVPESSVPEGDGLPPGQPYVSPDDLTSIPPLYQEAAASQVLPIVAEVFVEAGARVYANMVEASSIAGLPSVGSLAAEQYLARAKNTFDEIGDSLWAQARSELTAGFEAGESIPQLAERLRASAGVTARTGVLVARTQVNEASNAGSFAVAQASGLQMQKEWIATPDLRTRPTHLAADGQRVDLNEPFIVGGFSAMFPAAPTLPPAERYSCRCAIGYVMPDRAPAEVRTDDLQAQQLEDLPGTSSPIDDLAATQSARLQQVIDEQHERVEQVIDDVHRRFGERFGREAGPGIDLPARGENPPGYIRPSLQAAKTPRQLRRVWRDEVESITGFPFVVDSMPRGISMVTAREYAEGTLQMFAQFPAAKVDRIHWFDDPASSSYAQVRRGGHAIEFNMRYASEAGRPKFLAARRRDVAGWDDPALSTSWSVRNDLGGQGVAYHEFTHTLDIENGREAVHGQIVPLLIRHAEREGITDIEDLIKRRISSYAASARGNLQELVAEAGTDVMVNGVAASQLSRDIFDLVRAEYRRRGFEIRTAPIDEGEVFPTLARRGTPADLHDLDASIRSVYEFTDSKTGISARVTKVKIGSGKDVGTDITTVEMEFRNAAGKKVGYAERLIYPASQRRVGHEAFFLDSSVQRQGFATRWNAYVEGEYQAHGIERIMVDAAGGIGDDGLPQIGSVVWARPGSGYTFASGRARRELAQEFRDASQDYSQDVRAAITRLADDPRSSPTDFLMIGHRDGDTSWPGLEIMKGASWQGEKRLAPLGEAFPKVAAPRALSTQTVAQLRALAKERGITIPAKARKADLVKALSEPVAPLDEKALLRAAARERNRLIESSQGTARLLAEVDELIANKATKVAIRQRLDPALIAPEQVFAGADPAVVEALRKALDTGDPAKLRAALTRAGTKSKLKPISKAGAKTKFDAETMEGVGGIDIPSGAQVTVVRRGTTLTLPDGSTMQLTRAQVIPIAPKPAPVRAVRAPAKRVPPPDEKVLAYQARQAELERLASSRPVGVENLEQGLVGRTDVAIYGDGRRVVRKTNLDESPGEAIRTTDAEELSAMVLDAVGARVPAVVRTGETSMIQEFVDGTVGGKSRALKDIGYRRELYDSDDGHLIGIADVLTENSDRGGLSNFIIDPDGRIWAIDQGSTFIDDFHLTSNTSGGFSERFLDYDGIASTNDMSPADMAIILGRLRGLEPEFRRLGHPDWFEAMMARANALTRAASGTRSRLTPAIAPKPAPVKAAKRAPRGAILRSESVVGRDLTTELDAQRIADLPNKARMNEILHSQGFDARPMVGDVRVVDQVIDAGGIELFRGSSAERARELIQGDLAAAADTMGGGSFGTGIYTGGRGVAERYAGESGLSRMALRADAKIIKMEDLRSLRRQMSESWTIDQAVVFADEGRFAAALGYDALAYGEGPLVTRNFVVLNRSALTIERDPVFTTAQIRGLPPKALREYATARGIPIPEGARKAEIVSALTETRVAPISSVATPAAQVGRVAPGPAYETRMRDIRRLEKASETKPSRQLGGGSTSDVTLLTRADGQVVEKVYGRRVPGTKAAVAKEVDAEELAPLVVQEFGVRAAATARTGADRVIMEFVDGETFSEKHIGYWEADYDVLASYTETDEGRLLGLADYVMGNTDRNEGNWIIRTVDGQREIVAIDHGYAFTGLRGLDPPAGFFGEFLQDRAAGFALRAQIDVNPADLAVIRNRLEGLRQRFVEAGRKPWHDAMMRRLRALEQRADLSAPIRLATT